MVDLLKSLPSRCACTFLRLYQLVISPLIGPRCRFYPSCSQYAIESIRNKGFAVGSLLSIKRLSKCRPGHPGGIDLPPSCSACTPQNHREEKHAVELS